MSIFEATGSSDPLGLWEPISQVVSFGMEDETALDAVVPVFRVNLPASVGAANNALSENLANFERMDTALAAVPGKLEGLVQRSVLIQQKAASGVAFSITDVQPESELESELLSLMAISEADALGRPIPGDVSFGIIDSAGEVLGQAKKKFENLVVQVNHEILHFAWVETVIAEKIVARTQVNWGGDALTILDDATSTEQLSLHQRTLQVVSRTRNLKLRLLFTVTSGAAKLAALMATPGGAVLALPAVYHYVIRILDQVKQLNEQCA